MEFKLQLVFFPIQRIKDKLKLELQKPSPTTKATHLSGGHH